MATSLPGFYGLPSQDAEILARRAGTSHPDHGADESGQRLGELGMPVYDNPLPQAGALPSFTESLSQDRTPHTHAAPTTGWAQLDASTAQQISNEIHGQRFAYPHTSRYVPANRVPTELVWDVDPGSSNLAREVPDQIRFNGRGSKDIAQGGGVPNGYDFGSHHTIRYRSTGWVPTWFVESAERPIRTDPMQGRNRAFSVDSTYGTGGQVLPMANDYVGAPTAYQTPANPQTNTDYGPSAGFAW